MKNTNWFAGLLMAGIIGIAPMAVHAGESYPNKAVTVVVGFPPGSSTDVATRVISNKLSQTLGQTFIVENRPGASSDIAAHQVAKTNPDGYTLFVLTIANAINSSSKNPNLVDVVKSFDPIVMLGSVPNVLVANPNQDLKTVDDLVKTAKAKPGGVTFASSGNGTSPHLAGELFSHMAGIKMLHVPYRGSSPAVADLLAGHVAIMFAPASTALPHIQSGKLVPLAAASSKRISALPGLTTLSEYGLEGFDTSVWFGLVAPAGTPKAIKVRLSQAVQSVLDAPDVKEQFRAQGIEAVKAGPVEFGQYINAEIDKWADVMKQADVKL